MRGGDKAERDNNRRGKKGEGKEMEKRWKTGEKLRYLGKGWMERLREKM